MDFKGVKTGIIGTNHYLIGNEELPSTGTTPEAMELHGIFKKMYDAGCRWLLLGIETGSKETRVQIDKPMDHNQIRSFVDNCTQVGISTFGSFIIGFPDETPERLKETAEFALSLNLDAFLFNYFIAIPKTPLCDSLIAE